MFWAESREQSSKDGMSSGSLVGDESQKFFFSEKCSIHDSSRSALLYEVFWFMPVSPCSGSIHDLAHISTQNCLAVCLTKASAKADNLITTVQT